MIFAKVLVHLLKNEAPTFFTDRWFEHRSKQLDFDMTRRKCRITHHSTGLREKPRRPVNSDVLSRDGNTDG
jgi:hypothetical protein